MFDFKNLQDTYQIYVRHSLPDDRFHSYQAKIELKAHRVNKTHYLFTLLRRYDVLFDDIKPDDASIDLMAQIGDSLYPLELSVSSARKILDIENFEEVKLRWTEKRAELLEKYHTFEFEQYLKASEKNMTNKQHFLNTLKRDAFIQFYFLPYENEIMTFDVSHFPKHGCQLNCFTIRDKKDSTINAVVHTIFPAFMDPDFRKTSGTIHCIQTKIGDFEQLELNIDLLMKDQQYFRRKVSLSRDKNGERAVNLWLY